MELGHNAELSMTTCQLAEQYQVGQPLGFYHMHPWWIRSCRIIMHVLLSVAIIVLLFVLILLAIFFYQYLTLPEDQLVDLRWRLLFALPGLTIGLVGCAAFLMLRQIFAQRIPTSLLVCTEGILEIRPKTVDVTRWDEVKGTLQGPGMGEKRRYTLVRSPSNICS